MSAARVFSLVWLAVAVWAAVSDDMIIAMGALAASNVWHAADWLARKGGEA